MLFAKRVNVFDDTNITENLGKRLENSINKMRCEEVLSSSLEREVMTTQLWINEELENR